MKSRQTDFIQLALDCGVLKFGEFKLKSGRLSPYFFNAGLFHDGNAFYQLASLYADMINENFAGEYDVLFGPAYKGIFLATSASIGLKIKYSQNIPVCFSRKEVKDHGEGGSTIGASLAGQRVLLVDDVITAGTTIREAVATINQAQGKLSGIVVALDRQEKGTDSQQSAIQEVAERYQLKVSSLITLDHLVEYLNTSKYKDAPALLEKVTAYRKLYGISK